MKKKSNQGTEGETSCPIRAMDTLIGDEEQRRKKKKRNKERVPTPATLDDVVSSYDPHITYGGPILNPTFAGSARINAKEFEKKGRREREKRRKKGSRDGGRNLLPQPRQLMRS